MALSQADRALGRLDGSIQTLPHPDLLEYMYVRKEAVLLSQIEGTQSSLQDVIAAEAKILAPDRPQAHVQFETIHPFLDGSGRVGRLLITFLLCERQVLLKPVLYLSYFFKHHRPQYYEHLQAVRDTGAWEEWLQFFLNGVIEVSGQATETARKILSLREQHRLSITEKLGRAAANGYRVLEHLYQHLIVSVNEVQTLIGTTYPAANDLVARLVDCGILAEITGQQRNQRYMYKSYIDLFHDPSPEQAQ
ncbi:MAG: Fic family protein [Planctomycetaceae bacterium]|nr:Fic family protein [Planctomycetaceae bacterium]